MNKNIFIDPAYKWKSYSAGEYQVHFVGREKTARELLSLLTQNAPPGNAKFISGLLGLTGNFAAIVDAPGWVLAVADKIRAHPVCYVEREGAFGVSNSARLLRETFKLTEPDDLSVLEFQMAGYVTGRDTLFKNLHQMQAGEFMVWDKKESKLKRERYYLFYSEKMREEPEEGLIGELDEITTNTFKRVIEDVDGRPIWIPLSGGLDSRLVACKLKELGHDDLHTYSYGPPGNYEAKTAEIVAKQLGVPWTFIPILRKDMRKFFWSQDRKTYTAFADHLSVMPIFQDISVQNERKYKKIVPEDAVFINGQSGDFITGGHVPEGLTAPDAALSDVLRAVVDKHFSLWKNLKSPENIHKIETKIKELLSYELKDMDGCRLFQLLELWEWQERQCKYVVNNVRIYEYLNYSWQMPLWSDEYLLYWREIPVEFKLNQNLYKKYLRKYNHKNLFKDFERTVWRWPGMTRAVVPMARLIGLIAGKNAKESFYDYMRYFGHYSFQYGAYPYSYFFKHAKNARNPISFFVKSWLEENMNRETG